MIEIKNISYQYPNGFEAIKDLTLSIKKGDSIGIIGSNGAGKSTLLHTILGLNYHSSGEIEILGERVTPKHIKNRLMKVGMIFQNPDHQLFMNTVFEDVAFGPNNEGLSSEEVEKNVNEALAEVGIMHLKNKSTFKLSGGEKRAVAISTVLSMKPEIILMDEPASNLDAKTRKRLIRLINNLPQTKLITSHDLDFVMETTTRVIIMGDGRIIDSGTTNDILRNAALLESCGLELPLRLQGCPICSKIEHE